MDTLEIKAFFKALHLFIFIFNQKCALITTSEDMETTLLVECSYSRLPEYNQKIPSLLQVRIYSQLYLKIMYAE